MPATHGDAGGVESCKSRGVCWHGSDALWMDYQGQVFRIVSRADLIAARRAAGRDIDLQDVALIEQV